MNRIGFGVIALSIFSVSAFVSVSVHAQELVQQPGCNMSGELAGWKVSSFSAYKVTDKKIPLGQIAREGDALFYVSLKDVRRVYKANGEIQFKDKSPLNRDFSAQSGDLFDVTGVMKNAKEGLTYDIIETEGSFLAKKYFPVKPDGYICSNKIGRVEGKHTQIGMPMVFQDAPLTASYEDIQDAKTRSISISLIGVSGAIANIQASLMVNGQESRKVSRGFDVFSGSINLDGLVLKIRKSGNGLQVQSVSEPGNYNEWISDYFSRR